jgi:hypothetical protein
LHLRADASRIADASQGTAEAPQGGEIMTTSRAIAFAVGLVLPLSALATDDEVQPNPERNAYFGESHVHTSWSLDAFAIGNIVTTPADSYKYFKGEPIKHPLGYEVKIDTPLDWAGVTDHSEYAGIVQLANQPGSAVSKIPEAQPLILKSRTPADMQRLAVYIIGTLGPSPPVKALMSPEIAGSVWKENVKMADAANEPGTFTAFCSYEWTSMPNAMNMHRNVFFKDCSKVPAQPFSALDSKNPPDLWNWMDAQRKAGNELLAISHNPNLSDGRMFPTEVDITGRPLDAAYAASRVRNEPLVEIKQLKGTSETHPLLSPNDEFAGFELMSTILGGPPGLVPHLVGSYARQALKDGIAMQDTRGFNPYKFGVGGASDSHNTAVPYRQGNFFGGHSVFDGTPEARMSGTVVGGFFDARMESTAGLMGVWAEENTRASLFNGMQRRETFAVSGPQIKVRFFGGWNYDLNRLQGAGWVADAYANGVTMGSDLPPIARAGVPPSFVVWATKDPTSGNLDRIQIVKGWTESGQSFEKVYDVVWAGDRKPDKFTGRVPPIASTVDVENATYTNTVGAVELKTVWSDPDFRPGLHAFYYARVLEIPTPRWSTIQAKQLGVAPPDVVAATLQERAWSSPIWYTPSADARKSEKVGLTVAELKRRGATALGEAELRQLIEVKTIAVQNTVTSETLTIVFSALGKAPNTTQLAPDQVEYTTQQFPAGQGYYQIRYVGKNEQMASLWGDAARASYQGLNFPYNIVGGRIQTSLAGSPIETTVYKLGDKYYAARSNEFGYANYEMVAGQREASPLGAAPRSP